MPRALEHVDALVAAAAAARRAPRVDERRGPGDRAQQPGRDVDPRADHRRATEGRGPGRCLRRRLGRGRLGLPALLGHGGLERPPHGGVLLALRLGLLERGDLLLEVLALGLEVRRRPARDFFLAVSSKARVRSRSCSEVSYASTSCAPARAAISAYWSACSWSLTRGPEEDAAGVDRALDVAQDGQLLDGRAERRRLLLHLLLLGFDLGQVVLGLRHLRLRVGEGLGRGVGLPAGPQDVAGGLLGRLLVLVRRLRGGASRRADGRTDRHGQEGEEDRHREQHTSPSASRPERLPSVADSLRSRAAHAGTRPSGSPSAARASRTVADGDRYRSRRHAAPCA